MRNIIILLVIIVLAGSLGFINKEPSREEGFAKGADVGWLTEMEAKGYKFYDRAGKPQECLKLLKDLGFNAIRIRVWVNPAHGWNGTKDVLLKAKRAKALGLQIMIDFHYSDDWADPAKQYKPGAWVKFSAAELADAVYNHTYHVLDTLKANGIQPTWVQVGNEITNGMLWPEGKTSNFGQLTQMINKGYAAAKAVDRNTIVIVHLDNGYDNNLYRHFFDSLQANGGKYDLIGMSAYPYWGPKNLNWRDFNKLVLANMNDVVTRYGKPVMACETGMDYREADTAKAFLTDLISKVKSLPNHQGKGVFYWEPEAYNWVHYNLSAFDSTGKPTVALDAFAN